MLDVFVKAPTFLKMRKYPTIQALAHCNDDCRYLPQLLTSEHFDQMANP